MATIDLDGFGHNLSEDVTANKTLDLTDCGIVQNVKATCVVSLAATSGKLDHIIRVGKAGITVTIRPVAADKIAGVGAANTGAGADDKDLIFTNQPAGSWVQLHGDGTDGYTITRLLGSPTFEA